jgi:hypothetical protein
MNTTRRFQIIVRQPVVRGCGRPPAASRITGRLGIAQGSTLTEVLVALMVASIGLVSVATLFPMSVLRSVKAAQMTNAADAADKARSVLDLYPDIIKHPDARTPSALSLATDYTYSQNNNRTYSDPNWTQLQLQGNKNYVFDPLGFAAVQNLNLTIGANANAVYQTRPEHFFGNDPSGGNLPPWPNNPPGNPWQTIPRYPLYWRAPPTATGASAFALADSLVTLPDAWELKYETIGGTFGGANASSYTQITLPNFLLDSNTSLAPSTATPSLPYPTIRVVMISADGSVSQTRQVTSFSTNATDTTLTWNEINNSNVTIGFEDVNANGTQEPHYLPASFTSFTLGKVRVETQVRRYSWLLTVRSTSANSASIDVVVYFQRALENIGVDEVLYDTRFTQGSNQAVVTYPTGSNTVTGVPLKPFMRRGGFVFDANNAFWYRITNVSDNNAGTAVLTLETPAQSSTGSPPYYPPRAMFPRGVIDVFPLGTRTVQ